MAFETTVKTLRHDVARRVRDLWTGSITTAASAAATSIVDTKRVEIANYFTNAHIHIGVDAQAEDLRVSANTANGALTITPALTSAKDDNTVYELHKLWSVPDYNGFIADAIRSLSSEAVLTNLDSTQIEVESNANKPNGIEDEYILPVGFRYVSEFWLADSAGHFDQRIPNDQVKSLPGRVVRFNGWATGQMTVGREIRVIGQGNASPPALADTSKVYVDPDYIVTYVEHQVLVPLSGGTSMRALAARDRVRNLSAMIEMKRSTAVNEHRVRPGVLVVH